MKHVLSRLSAFVMIVASVTACEKQTSNYGNPSVNNNAANQPAASRKIDFVLYTDQNFSTDNNTIIFNPYIKDSTGKTIWDTTLPAMKVKDIPDMSHQLLISKTITGYTDAALNVGFNYSLENVGNSWYIDFSKPGETTKTVIFNFK